jgi:hypothetical protein
MSSVDTTAKASPDNDPVFRELEAAVNARGVSAAAGTDQFSALASRLISEPKLAADVSGAIAHGKAGLGWNELVGLLAALGVYASAQALYYLVTADSSANTLTALTKLFGHTNVETLN